MMMGRPGPPIPVPGSFFVISLPPDKTQGTGGHLLDAPYGNSDTSEFLNGHL